MTASRQARVFLGILAAMTVFGLGRVSAQENGDRTIVNPATSAKFGAVPNAPKCFTVAVEKGDPSKDVSIILAKFAPGCVAPWHWHTPTETVMVVSGSLEVQNEGRKSFHRTSRRFRGHAAASRPPCHLPGCSPLPGLYLFQRGI